MAGRRRTREALARWIRTTVMAGGGLAAVVIIFLRIGDPAELWAHAAAGATWGWVVLALVVSLLTSVPFAVAFIGTVPRQRAVLVRGRAPGRDGVLERDAARRRGERGAGALPAEAGRRPRVGPRGRRRVQHGLGVRDPGRDLRRRARCSHRRRSTSAACPVGSVVAAASVIVGTARRSRARSCSASGGSASASSPT